MFIQYNSVTGDQASAFENKFIMQSIVNNVQLSTTEISLKNKHTEMNLNLLFLKPDAVYIQTRNLLKCKGS